MKPLIPNSIESRFLPNAIELRAEENMTPRVRGYAAKYNSRSENLGGKSHQFYEIIMPGAFDNVLNDDVRALLNHESSAILARSKNGEGSLKIGTDETGLWYEFEAPDTQIGRDLVTSLKRGDIDQSSFSFTVDKDGESWESKQEGDGPVVHVRTITKVARLYDVSPVTYPAYPDATVALRSLEEFRKATPDEPEPQENHSVSHWERRHAIMSMTPAV
jgi:HK97 family phage prohead protease